MDPRDIFRAFLGLPRHHPGAGHTFPEGNQDHGDDDFEEQHNFQEPPSHFRGSFRVFSDPLEMESFFSQQFDDILKQFGFGSGFGQFGQIPGQQDEQNLGDRDFMLRKDDHPGYIQRERGQPKQDSEIDEVNPEDLKRLYDPIPKAPQIHPGRDSSPFQGFPGDHHGQESFSRTFSFGQSYSSSSKTLPDGSVEETTTTKDNNGRETVKVSRRSPVNKCHTVTTVRHPDGKVERTEDNTCPHMRGFRSSLHDFGHRQEVPSLNTDTESLMDRFFR